MADDQQTREREVIVTGRRGPGPGAIIGVVLGVVAILIVAWLLFFQGGEAAGPEIPEDVDVNIENPQNPNSG